MSAQEVGDYYPEPFCEHGISVDEVCSECSEDTQMSNGIHDSQTCNCDMCRWANERERRMAPQTDFESINREWVIECERAMAECPAGFLSRFTELMLIGQRLITEARVTAQIDAAKDEMKRRIGG